MTVFSLSVHAHYACGHSGACCTAGWNIPVDPHLQTQLGATILVPDASGTCLFFDRPTRLCRVHRDHGEALLPATCRQFPRRALVDDRGVFVTLSHFCPTAARMLVDDPHPLTIVANPPAFPATRDYDGLDARGAWPPLVRPRVLFDLATYSRWERFVVNTLGGDAAVEDAFATIAHAAENLRAWTHERGTLAAWTESVLSSTARTGAARALDCYAPLLEGAYARVCRMVPAGLPAPEPQDSVDRVWDVHARPEWPYATRAVRRYCAAKAFGGWSAYQSRGMRTLIAEMLVSEQVLRVEAARACQKAERPLDRELLIDAIRASDHLLVHLVDRDALVDWLGAVEG